MNRSKTRWMTGVSVCASVLGVAVLACVPLLAQPEPKPKFPTSPTSKLLTELVVPPGIYTGFVFAIDGTGDIGMHVTLRSASGELHVVVPQGETVVVPVGTWSLGQAGTIKTESPFMERQFFVTGLTTSGPVQFKPAAK